MPKKLSALVATIAMSSLLLFSAGSAAVAAPPAPDLDAVPITGSGPISDFTGSFDVTRFAVQGGELVAVGTLTGTLTNTVTGATQNVSQQVSLPVDVAQASCEILDLVLGPLELDLLGLVVELDTVHLNITAEQGPGNLLGNLLCGIAGLLDGNSPLNAIARLLNQLLGVLNLIG